ncbi:MAG: 5-(carboxyamino)imidazole ribonucleotide synthase [Bdellovibrionales bacterium]|nr:5-(carboxyamino)imidazole ribonucleotide synthase [Bdellovibrionales bacterium]
MKRNYSKKNVGILGGGQLARMLVLKGHELGLRMHVLSENEDDPAAQVTRFWHQGSLSNKKSLVSFLKNVDVTTFESEFLDADLLQDISREHHVQIYPRPYLMARLQDRWLQKQMLNKHNMKTADFLDWKDTLRWEELHKFSPKGLVFKARRFGYDGYGTFIIKNSKAYENFIVQARENPHGFIIEPFIPFKRELSLICARNKMGQFVHFPLAETYQKDARCFWVKGPVKHSREKEFINSSRRFLNSINYVGVMGIEIFDTGKELLVNELAPRVHNTGHHSLDSLNYDQFTYHLLCLISADLPKPELVAPAFAMVNLLGEKSKLPSWEIPNNAQVYWYGKEHNRPGRKMGHINSIANNPKAALNQALKALKEFSL